MVHTNESSSRRFTKRRVDDQRIAFSSDEPITTIVPLASADESPRSKMVQDKHVPITIPSPQSRAGYVCAGTLASSCGQSHGILWRCRGWALVNSLVAGRRSGARGLSQLAHQPSHLAGPAHKRLHRTTAASDDLHDGQRLDALLLEERTGLLVKPVGT